MDMFSAGQAYVCGSTLSIDELPPIATSHCT